MSRSHSQIMALPVIPPLVESRIACMKEFYSNSSKCIVCQMIEECRGAELLIIESKLYAAIAPYAATFAFEIVPQLSIVAGFEIATGCHINPVFPEDAAKLLREAGVELQE
ncbi:hypothetical protein QQ045_022137 [Rhodiola kirilowii]